MRSHELGSGRVLSSSLQGGGALVPAYAAFGLLALAALGCSGEAFRLASLEVRADGGRDPFDRAVTQDDLDGDPRSDDMPSDGQDAGAGSQQPGHEPDSSAPDPAPPGACGVLRSNEAALANGEVCVEVGSFTMGSAAESLGAGYVAHGPEHSVTLSAFVLDAYEVSVARYRACVQAGTCAEPSTTLAQGCTYTTAAGERELHPVTCVSWQQASDFCAWDDGRRLPTEAEWERAARGAGSASYPWGASFDCSRAVLAGTTQCNVHSGVTPKAGGSAPAGKSVEGAFDLIGNAAEWVADWFGPYPSGAATNPTGPATGSTRIQRGGNWQTRAIDAVGYGRRAETPGAVGSFSFRCARSAP